MKNSKNVVGLKMEEHDGIKYYKSEDGKSIIVEDDNSIYEIVGECILNIQQNLNSKKD